MIIAQNKDVSAEALSFIAHQAYQGYCAEMGRVPAPMVADYAQHLREDILFTVQDGHQLVGFAILVTKSDGYWLETIAILPAYSGQGIGTKLMQVIEAYLIRHTSSYQLYTNKVMRDAQRWYITLGFEETDRRQSEGFQRIYYKKKF